MGPDEKKTSRMDRVWSIVVILLFVFKNVLTVCLETTAFYSLLASALCLLPDDVKRVQLYSNILFTVAITNMFHSILGVKMAVMHTTSFLTLCPMLFFLNTPDQQCPGAGDLYAMGKPQRTLEWTSRLQYLQGALILMAICQILFTMRGVYHWICQIVTPINLISTIIFIPIALCDNITDRTSKNIFIALGTILVFSLFSYGITCIKLKLFESTINLCSLFSLTLTVAVMWTVCFLLSHFELMSQINQARTDYHETILLNLKHSYHLPQFFQYGYPKFSLSAISIIVPVAFVGTSFTVENYRTCNKLQGLKDRSQVSRGLYVDSICLMLNAIFGSATGFHVSNQSIKDITDTRIWNQLITNLSSIFLILITCSTHVCARLIIIPAPIIGSLICIILVEYLVCWWDTFAKRIDLSKRNVFIIIISILTTLLFNHGLSHINISNDYMSSLILVNIVAIVLNIVTRNQSNNRKQDFNPIEPILEQNENDTNGPFIDTNDRLHQCVESIENITTRCFTCLV